MDRSPPWTIWKNISKLKVFEAVALSLNIDPRKLRRISHGWTAGKRLFNEGQEFNDRLFIAERNLADIGVINSVAVGYEGQEAIVRLDLFVQWALRIGWSLPAELSENRGSQAPELPPAPREGTKSEAATKRDLVRDFVAKHYSDRIPPGVRHKHIAREVEAETKVRADERTVRRALGRR
jgi:hypothetical protein